MQEKGQVQCVRLLESQAEGWWGWGVGGGGGEAGRLILGVGGQGGQREGVAVWCGLGVVLFLLSQMEFGSAHLL